MAKDAATMRVGIIGGGTIARLFLEHIQRGDLGDTDVVALVGRNDRSRGRPLAAEFGVPFVTGLEGLLAEKPDVVVEAASHEAVQEYAETLLGRGIATIVLSGGALCDDALRARIERAAEKSGALLYVPSGGIGGLDALKAACVAGVDEVTIAVTKPPAAWKGIPYVERLGVDLAALREPRVLFDGSGARRRAAFSREREHRGGAVAGGNRLRPDPSQGRRRSRAASTTPTTSRSAAGPATSRIKLENVPAPENPKTAWLACYSALAALKAAKSAVRYGT